MRCRRRSTGYRPRKRLGGTRVVAGRVQEFGNPVSRREPSIFKNSGCSVVASVVVRRGTVPGSAQRWHPGGGGPCAGFRIPHLSARAAHFKKLESSERQSSESVERTVLEGPREMVAVAGRVQDFGNRQEPSCAEIRNPRQGVPESVMGPTCFCGAHQPTAYRSRR